MDRDQSLPDVLTQAPDRAGFAIWLTGPPASGKTTLAYALQRQLADRGLRALVLDGDELRHVLARDPLYSQAECDRFYAVVAFLAAWLTRNGANVLIAATGHRRAYREQARQQIAHFFEVFVMCPVAVCRQRDPKGLYAQALAGQVSELPGIGVPYELPLAPDAIANTGDVLPDEAARDVLAQIGVGTAPFWIHLQEVGMITCLDRLQHWLREQHVGYSIRHHHQALAWENMAAELHENSAHVARSVIAQADGRRVLLVIPVTEQVDFQRVARLLQAQSAVPAREGDFEAGLPDCELDALPPFGSLFQLPTYLDEGLARMSQIVFLAGTHHATIKVATDEYVRAAQPIIGQLTGPHITPGRNGRTKIELATSTTRSR